YFLRRNPACLGPRYVYVEFPEVLYDPIPMNGHGIHRAKTIASRALQGHRDRTQVIRMNQTVTAGCKRNRKHQSEENQSRDLPDSCVYSCERFVPHLSTAQRLVLNWSHRILERMPTKFLHDARAQTRRLRNLFRPHKTGHENCQNTDDRTGYDPHRAFYIPSVSEIFLFSDCGERIVTVLSVIDKGKMTSTLRDRFVFYKSCGDQPHQHITHDFVIVAFRYPRFTGPPRCGAQY